MPGATPSAGFLSPTTTSSSAMKPTDEESTIVEDVVVTETGSLARRSLASVHDAVDPRIRPSDRPTDDVLDEGYARQLSDYIGHKHHHEKSPSEKEGSQKDSDEPIYVSLRLL